MSASTTLYGNFGKGGRNMKYKTLIKRFEKYADEEVSIVAGYGDVVFFPASDGNIEIIHLVDSNKEPFRAREVKD